MATIGATYRFDYPAAFVTLPDYTAHSGHAVKVLCQLGEPDVEVGDEFEAMYHIRAEDGWEGSAFASELTEVINRP
jgi:hypothetical protein